MLPITLERFLEQRGKTPKRRIFSQHSGVQKDKANPSFSVKFYESVGPIYEAMTGNTLHYSHVFGNYWHFLSAEKDIADVEAWEAQQQHRVFLRDCLSCSIALSVNRDNPEADSRTEIGQLEYLAKNAHDEKALEALAEHLANGIDALPLYNETTLIAAVPARPGKTSPDLPTRLVERIAAARGLTNLTPYFQYGGTKGQVKEMPFEERWPAWERAQLSLTTAGAQLVNGRSVILVDDKYQSGVSVNFVGMILQQHGATEVYGLFAVKTLRDNDND